MKKKLFAIMLIALAFGASWATGELLYRVPKLRWLVS